MTEPESSTMISIRLPKSLLDAIDKLCYEEMNGKQVQVTDRSAVIRDLLVRGIREVEMVEPV